MNWTEVSSVSATLFLIMDPLGNVPIFHSVLSRVEPDRRRCVMVRELVVALVILLGFLLVGNVILSFLGLSQPSLNIAGGIILFIMSLRMIFPTAETLSDADTTDPFIVPLAVPLIAGPSTIAMLLLLSSTRPEALSTWSFSLIIAWLGTTILLVGSPWLLKRIGTRGARALERLMGMILVILATQMLLNGIRDFLTTILT